MTTHDWTAITADLPAGVRDVLAPGARAVVTGCAGFVGSHVAEALLALGCEVTGVDSLTDYYDVRQKRDNLAGLLADARFTFVERDLNDLDARELLAGARACFHLAAQAGVRASWGAEFTRYLDWNVLATQRLLEACRDPRGGGFAGASRLLEFEFGVRRPAALPGHRGRPPAASLAVRREQARRGTPLRALRGGVRRADGESALLHGLRPAAAARHGVPQVPGSGAGRSPVPDLRGRPPDPRLHLRDRRGPRQSAERGGAGRRPRVQHRRRLAHRVARGPRADRGPAGQGGAGRPRRASSRSRWRMATSATPMPTARAPRR